MARITRQSKIIDLINKTAVETQEELQQLLADNGFYVTQATVSRDIKELGLIKIASENGYRYAVDRNTTKNVSVKMSNMFRESVLSMDSANNLIVIKTLAGSAEAAGVLIDHLDMDGVMCCISGDDAVLVVAKAEEYVQPVLRKLNEIINM